MDFEIHYTDQQQQFREALRAWLENNAPKDIEIPTDGRPLDRETQQTLRDFRCKLDPRAGWHHPGRWSGAGEGCTRRLSQSFLKRLDA